MKYQRPLGSMVAYAALSVACFSSPALAQEAKPQESPPPVAPEAAQNDDIQVVIVTANKRAESLQSVPAAITAISGDTLTKNNISDLSGVANRTPGLTFAAFATGQPEIAIRGVGTKEDGPAASDSTVVSVDEVYIAARSAQVFDLFDLDRVEILRGPQGTLYGKNSIGGSINFVTLQPNATTHVKTQVKLGNFGRADVGGLVSGQIADGLFGKIAASYRSSDGYLRDILVGSPLYGKRLGATESVGFRGTLRWVPSDRVETILILDYARDNNGATNREPVGSLGPLHNCGCASDPMAVNAAFGGTGSPYTTLADVEGFTKRNIFGASVRVNWQLDFATLTSISSYRRTNYNYLEDSSGLPTSTAFTDLTGAHGSPNLTLLGPATNGFTFKITDGVTEAPEQYTQELRLTSPSGGRLDWVTGAFYSLEKNFRTEEFFFPSLGGADLKPSDSFTLQSNKSTSYAAYAQGGYKITDKLKLTVGARYSEETKDITSEGRIISGLPLLLQAYSQIQAEKGWSNISWRVVGDYQLAKSALVYASVATGFKSGGFTGSASTAATASKPFNPENATTYEVGTKSEFFQRHLRLNVAGFYTDYKDLQVTRFFQPLGTTFGQFITENAGTAVTKGVELEVVARPVSGLEIGGTYAYLDARYTHFTGLASTIGTGNFDGKRLRQSPKDSASAYISYTYNLASGASLSALTSWKYQSLSYYDPDNNPITVIPAYQLVDAHVDYKSAGGRWTLSLWGKNLGDTHYRTHVFSQRDGRVAFALFGDPRTYGLTLGYSY